jgi:flagellar biosynthesis/type III secretory pathway protein FliH
MMKNYTPILILLSFSLFACNQPAEDPKSVADRYWQYLQQGNVSEAEKLVSTNTRHIFSEHSSRVDANAQLENGEAKTFISTTITTVNPSTNFRHTQTFDTVLVLEHGQWKVDINQSKIPPSLSNREEELHQLKNKLEESMQENMESIDETMNQGMQMLNEALQEGSEEMGNTLLNLMNDLNKSMQESIDKMKQRREQQLQEQQQQQQPAQPQQPKNPQLDPAQGEGMI